MDKINFYILDTLFYNSESMTQIYPLKDFLDVSRDEIVDRLYALYKQGYIELDNNIDFNINEIKSEPEKKNDTKYWFGFTEKGFNEWEKEYKKYYSDKINFSKYAKMYLDYEKCEGNIVGLDVNYLKEKIDKFNKENNNILIILDSIEINKINEFVAYYYKKLRNGYEICFKILKYTDDIKGKDWVKTKELINYLD